MKKIAKWGGIIIGLWIVAAVIWSVIGGGGESKSTPPDTAFLGAELFVMAGGSPMAGEVPVKTIIDALDADNHHWENPDPGQYLLEVERMDKVTGKTMNMKMLFVQLKAEPSGGVMLKRVVANGQDFNTGQIFQLARQLALRAEAKK